jgi:hypothetical protein
LRVKNHVAALREKRTEVDPRVTDVYDKRLKSLSPNHAIIRLPDNRNYVLASQEIDYILRSIASLVSQGVIEVGGRRELAAMILASTMHAYECKKTLRDLGAMVFTSENLHQQEA